MSFLQKIFKATPLQVQNTTISLVTTNLYRVRHSGKYNYYRSYYAKWDEANESEILEETSKRLKCFLEYAKKNSTWYSDQISEESIITNDLRITPVLEKKEIIDNLSKMKTIKEKDGLVNSTGGTTGASMKTVYTKGDMQERFAILDNFRAKHGYKLGKKTAWFSGKNLISEKDIKNGVCSHYDFINKIRFYSTFHISKQNFDIYWNSLNKFKPEFIVGFPSSVYEICEIADRKGLKLNHKVSVFFPTAETVLPQHREVIGRVLGCKLVDQYASSEGAPFILECTEGKLHIHPLTGIFEVVDENMQPAREGEILVTSFTTKGTPLIRYRVGDRVKLAEENKTCKCGSSFPLVDRIEGRSNDFLYSAEKGKVYTVSLIDSTKGVKGLVSFQATQELQNEIVIKLVANDYFKIHEEAKFVSNVRQRVGDKMAIDLRYCDDIPREKSGKFRIVKNNLNLDGMQ